MKKATIPQPQSLPAQEKALDAICNNLSFAGKSLKKIVFTGSDNARDKGFLLLEVARILAAGGKKICLMDADLRHSDWTDRYGIQLDGAGQGLAHYFAGRCEMEEIQYETNLPGVTLIPAGTNAANPSLMFGSPEFSALLEDCAQKHDLILINASPIGPAADAAEIARHCDGAVLIAQHRKSHIWGLSDARQQLEQVHCPLIGCVITGARKGARYTG